MNHFHKSRNVTGSVLVFALVILAFSLVAALSMAAVSVTERKASFVTEKSSRSFQVADSGLETVLYTIYKKNDIAGVGLGPYPDLNELAIAMGGGFSCYGGEISKGTDIKTVISFYIKKPLAPAILEKVTKCDSSGNAVNWRKTVVKIVSEGTSGNTTRAVEVGLSALCDPLDPPYSCP